MIDLRFDHRRHNPMDFININAGAARALGYMLPAEFKPAGRRLVKGGRWKIRRRYGTPRPWRAYTDGKAKKWNRGFPTWEMAMRWSMAVATIYRLRMSDAERDDIIHRVWEEEYSAQSRAEVITSRYFTHRR